MLSRNLIMLSVALVILGAVVFETLIEEPDLDDPVLKQLIEELETEGYRVGSVETTVLGRYRIEAYSDSFEREIVVAPGAGTYLRDEILPLSEGDNDSDD